MNLVLRSLLPLIMVVGLSACATSQSASPPETPAYETDLYNDPFETFNRRMFAVDQVLDRAVIKPLAIAYSYIPDPIEKMIASFLNNIREPINLSNELLQGNFSRAGITASRFLINSTIGLAGLFDPASSLGLRFAYEDFGQTLAVWGVPEGPYLYLPILRSRPPRALFGLAAEWYLIEREAQKVTSWVYYIPDYGDTDFDPDQLREVPPAAPYVNFVLVGIAERALALGTLDEIERSTVDYYAAIRSLYRQIRQNYINNGALDLDALDTDLDALDDFDDYDD